MQKGIVAWFIFTRWRPTDGSVLDEPRRCGMAERLTSSVYSKLQNHKGKRILGYGFDKFHSRPALFACQARILSNPYVPSIMQANFLFHLGIRPSYFFPRSFVTRKLFNQYAMAKGETTMPLMRARVSRNCNVWSVGRLAASSRFAVSTPR